MVRDSQLQHDAVLVGEVNAHRKKGKPLTPMWKEKTRVDIEELSQLVHKQKKENISQLLKKIRGE